jgi:hypothetical protein
MANTTFNGPVRSQNGFQNISVNSSTGAVTILNNAGLAPVTMPNANVTLTNADNSGVVNIVADVTADRTYTLPTPVAGSSFTFIYGGGAADGHDAIFTTGSDLLYFVGGVVFLDEDGDAISMVFSDGNSNSKLQVNLPQAMQITFLGTSATTYQVYGYVCSTTAPTFADQ